MTKSREEIIQSIRNTYGIHAQDRCCGVTEIAQTLAEGEEVISWLRLDNRWHPCARIADELPPENTLVEVCGKSGMSKNLYFLTYALHMPTYRPLEPWRDIQLNALQDCGWKPLFWRFPEPLPEMP